MSIQSISVIVPANPFVQTGMTNAKHCLTALDVMRLMEWWPGKAHAPHRNPNKVKAIQRSLDWKRVVQIAAYLLQREVDEAGERVKMVFKEFYSGKSKERGSEWPPKLPKVVGYQRSTYPTFSNVLLHVNGAKIKGLQGGPVSNGDAAQLVFDANDSGLNFSVIDGQHRINGAYLAISILRETDKDAKWEIPAEIFLDLDKISEPPRNQAQIFIDVNFYQKKVDRSLVSDLYPTTRGGRDALDHKERAQDLGRKLMLEIGPLVGMIQIPGIKYGVKDVVTLATLVSALEDVIPVLDSSGISSLEGQADFVADCLEAWLLATGRKHELTESEQDLDAENVVYQGRILVSVINIIPACIWKLNSPDAKSGDRVSALAVWFRGLLKRARLLSDSKFIEKAKFKQRGFLGSGGIGRFRDLLWAAAIGTSEVGSDAKIAEEANANRTLTGRRLGGESR